MSLRAELARLVLQMLKDGQHVPAHDALQLRNWSINALRRIRLACNAAATAVM
jgi:hypothetical protein